MIQANDKNSGSHRSGTRVILMVGLVFALLIVTVTGSLAFFAHNLTGQQANSSNCSAASPYGFTTIHADAPLVTAYKQLNVCWVRYQYHWGVQGKKPGIETDTGVYNWKPVDTSIAMMNAAGIHVDFAIQYAPQWRLSQECKGIVFLPGAGDMKQFASMIATRYDGKHGHGHIDAFEIGNEEYDSFYIKGNPSSVECRSASYYGPVLKAGYQAIKAANPRVLVGMFGMWYHNLQHIKDFMTYLYAHGYGSYMDYMNYHYYNDGGDPAVTTSDRPSFDLWWQTMHGIATQYGYGKKPIWVTETGWPTVAGFNVTNKVTPQVQSERLQYIFGEAEKSHVIQKVFWFTIDYGKQSDSVNPPSGPLPAFYTLQKMVKQQPLWQ